MYPNLRDALDRKNITIAMYAKILGVETRTVQNKLNGVTDFTFTEIKTSLALFPEYRMEYLFATEETPS